MAAAEQVTSQSGLAALKPVAKEAPAFEALYAVKGQGDVSYQSQVMDIRPRASPKDWSQDPAPSN